MPGVLKQGLGLTQPLRVALLWGLGLALLLLSRPSRAASAVLEIADEQAGWVEPQMVRRLVTLELAEVVIPEAGAPRARSVRPGVFVRVLRFETQMVVELWQRGELAGQRRLTIAGSPQVRARRIALAAGELARRLRERRLAEERKARKRLAKRGEEAALSRGLPIYARLGLGSMLRTGTVGGADARLWGPELAVSLSTARGPWLALSGSVLSLDTPGLVQLRALEWWELGLNPGYAWRLSPRTRLITGLGVAAAVVHAQGPVALEAGGRTTWSARAALDIRLTTRLSKTTELVLGPELGAILHPVRLKPSTPQEPLQGVWIGLRLGVSLTPDGVW